MSLPPNLKELLGRARQLIVAESAAALSAVNHSGSHHAKIPPPELRLNRNQTPNINPLCKIHGCADPLDGFFSVYC
jgi:hypothetical protein